MTTLDNDNATRDNAIRSRAYEFWQAEGEVAGRALDHWLRAEAEIRAVSTPAATASAAVKKPARAAARKPSTRAKAKA